MPRTARFVLPGFPHHITQRGHNKKRIFWDKADHMFYFQMLNKYSSEHELKILGQCVMKNHVHIIAVPLKKDSLAKVFKPCFQCYAQYYNNKYAKVGHLWQDRFYSCAMDISHLLTAMKYIETNPVRAGHVKTPEEWAWSSAREHLGIEKGPVKLSSHHALAKINYWEKFLSEDIKTETIKKMRQHTYQGKPFVDKNFRILLEKTLGVSLVLKKQGRPSFK